MQNKKVSIVIRCYNEENHLTELFESIRRQKDVDSEIIFVDSGSTDSSVRIAQKYCDQIVHIKPQDFTFGRALNLGCSHASNEILVIVSAHVVPFNEDWLSKLIAPFEDPKVACTYGKQRGTDDSHFSEHLVFHKQFPDHILRARNNPFCNNANAAIRKSLWERRNYDETLPGLEDLDWAKWAVFNKYEVVYCHEAIIFHKHDESPSKIRSRYEREALAMKRIFPHTEMSFVKFLSLFIANVAMDFLSAIKRRRFNVFKDILTFRYNQYVGTYKGLKRKDDVTLDVINRYYYPRSLKTEKIGKMYSIAKDTYSKISRGTK